MDRRKFVRDSALLAASVRMGGMLGRANTSEKMPNIILITADDLGWRELGCYGNNDIKTPNIDAIACDGVRFTNAFVTAPTCSASRASIITGQASHSVGVHGLTHRHRQYQMSPEIPTLPRILSDAGYHTGIQGKWHVAPFKSVKKYGYQRRMSFQKIKNSNMARRFISANKTSPFYLELNFMQTHRLSDGNFKMAPEFPVDPNSFKVPSYWQIPDWPEVRQDVAGYYSQAAGMDKIIGEIMGHLESEALADNTLVIFVSDNGPPYPGCKTTCYDRGIGTPLILRWPDGLPRGNSVDALASTIDILPTCLHALKHPLPNTAQGRSLLHAARGDQSEIHDAVFAEVTYHVKFTPMRAIRTKEWKYIENLDSTPTGLDQNEKFEWAQRIAQLPGQRCCVERPAEELFHIAQDPDEKVNLASDPKYTAAKTKLKERLHQWRKETRDPYPDV